LKRILSTQLLVVGGGATGLGIAWDACLRGLKVVVVEKQDLGQGTSGRYHGLLHSGGRYVISDPTAAQECARENEILRRIVPTTIEDTGGYFVATPADPPDFPDRWFAAARQLELPCREISLQQARTEEPALSPRISRVFEVRDASLDSFDLAHLLVAAIRSAGGAVYLHHRLDSFLRQAERVTGASITNLASGETLEIGAELVVNSAGPWAGELGALADVDIPISLGKGTMLAMAVRPVNTIINRCNPPSDGDIIVPVGTVAVLGTTDVPVQGPEDLTIEPWEIDLLLGISQMRPLRAWAGIRPLYRPPTAHAAETRALPRDFVILDHEKRDGRPGMISIIGGKLTTFRLMAEQTVDLVCAYLDFGQQCATAGTMLSPEPGRYHTLPARLRRTAEQSTDSASEIICECELVTRGEIIESLQDADTLDFDSIRRDLRLGMGPCQAGFCAFRTAGLATQLAQPGGELGRFLEERWRGLRPVCWEHSLREMELLRRMYIELLGYHGEEKQ